MKGGEPPRFLLVGNPENRRVALFQAALARRGWPAAEVVSWLSLTRGQFDCLRHKLDRCTALRLESPGEQGEVERRLVTRGLELVPAMRTGIRYEADGLIAAEHGEILPSHAWYAGFSELVRTVGHVARECAPDAQWMNQPSDVLHWFDKPRVSHSLAQAGCPIPPVAGVVNTYEQLRALLLDRDLHRAFVKVRYSSSASGIIALQVSGRRVLAITPVELVMTNARPRCFNSLRVRRYERESDVATLVDALGSAGLHVERWLPKATWNGHAVDLRIVMIAAVPRQTVLRMSQHPFANLHLGNRRGDAEAFRRSMPCERWEAMLQTLSTVAGLYPNSLYFGADVLFTSGFARHAILELNAFGDLLPNVLHCGADTYASELSAWRPR